MDERDVARLEISIRELASEVKKITGDLPDRYIPRRDLDERFANIRESQRELKTDLEEAIKDHVEEALRPVIRDINAAHEAIRDAEERARFVQRAAITALISGLIMMGYTIVTQLILKHA